MYSHVSRPSLLYVPTCIANNMARSKDKKRDSENGEGDENKDESKSEEPTADYDELVTRVCAIAKPLAGRKLTKRLYKTVKKGKRGFMKSCLILLIAIEFFVIYSCSLCDITT